MPYMSIEQPVLNDDVLLRVICLCDIPTILDLSQTSRHFHDLAFSKQVWLTLLSDLYHRNFIDLLPGQHLNQLTANELVDLAKRTISGPRSWSDPTGPTIAHQVVLTYSITDPNYDHLNNDYLDRESKLLPGGQFVLFQHQERLECFATDGGKRIWEYRGSWEDYLVMSFAAEMVDEGQAAIIMISIRTYDAYDDPSTNFVEILRLNLKTGSAMTLIQQDTTNAYWNTAFSGLRICGDFAIAEVGDSGYMVIFGLSTGSYRWFFTDLGSCHDIDLIPGHLLVLKPSRRRRTLKLCVWSMARLLVSTEDERAVTDIPSVVTVTVKAPNIRQRTFRLRALPSPLREDSSTLWIFISSTYPEAPGSFFHKYHILHSNTAPLSVDWVTTMKLDKDYPASEFPLTDAPINMSYSGRALFRYSDEQQHLFSFASPDNNVPVDLPGRRCSAHMSPYSGALTYDTEKARKEIVYVNYYE